MQVSETMDDESGKIDANRTDAPARRSFTDSLLAPEGPSWQMGIAAAVVAAFAMLVAGAVLLAHPPKGYLWAGSQNGPYPVRIALAFGGPPAMNEQRTEPGFSLMPPLPAPAAQEGARQLPPRGDVPSPHLVRPPADAGGAPVGESRLRGLNFSIADGPDAARATSARKGFRINGAEVGTMKIQVTDMGSIRVDADDLIGAMGKSVSADAAQSLKSAAGQSSQISFEQLRSAGFDVRYDPIKDKVVINSAKP